MNSPTTDLIEDVLRLAHKAGEAVMEVYESDDFGVEHKDDESPLTRADLAAHDIIVDGLEELTPDIPVISEESASHDPLRTKKRRIWLVDPLDGTKEFVKQNGQFTVNIALIEDGAPILGVVHAPALGLTYWAEADDGAYKQVGDEEPVEIAVRALADSPVAAVSASHPSGELADWLSVRGIDKTIAIGSSLKLCYVADGTADVYPRLVPTMEWDTAAGDAVLMAAGGVSLTYPDHEPMIYNKENLLNPLFIAANSRQLITGVADADKLVDL